MQFNTPLRYPGGKGKLTEFIKLVIVENNLTGGEYFEPYAGGFAIALNLLFDQYVTRVHLNDINLSIFSFWSSVLNNPDEFCKKISDTEVTIDEWYKQKEIQKKPQDHSTIDLGFSTFFLNRTNRSGIIKAGVIGGKSQSGTWKLDARFNKQDLINRIEKIALQRDKISIYNKDAAEIIKSTLPELPLNTLIYLDPPYYVKGKGLYESHYNHDDHLEIAKLVRTKISQPWVVSYDYAPEIKDIYTGAKSINYGINYSAQNRYNGAEIMFFKDDVLIPSVEDPIKINVA